MGAFWRVLGGLLAAMLIASGALAQAREALVIANRDYAEGVGPLANTHEDADSIAAALRSVGFNVRVVKEASRLTVLAELREHAARLAAGGQGAIGLFYYAGHGAAEEISGRNFLIPIDVVSTADAQLWDASVDVADIQRRLVQAAPGANHFILFDACRNELRLPSRDASRGFVPVAQMGGMFVSFSTAPGMRASDGEPDEPGGPFALAFVEELARGGGRDATNFFSDVKFNVRDRTNSSQLPWQVDGLAERVYPFGAPGEEPPAIAAPASDAPAPDAPERLAYELAETPCDYAAFLEAYPQSVLAPLARARAADCGATAAASPETKAPTGSDGSSSAGAGPYELNRASPSCGARIAAQRGVATSPIGGLEALLASANGDCAFSAPGQPIAVDVSLCPDSQAISTIRILKGSEDVRDGAGKSRGPVDVLAAGADNAFRSIGSARTFSDEIEIVLTAPISGIQTIRVEIAGDNNYRQRVCSIAVE